MIDMSKIIVTKIDVLNAGFCSSGTREWCRLNGFTSKDVHDGIPADKMLATGCSLGAAVVSEAVKRAAREDGEMTDHG